MQSIDSPTAENGTTSRREPLPDPLSPGEPYGDAVKELYNLAHVAHTLSHALEYNISPDRAQGAAELLGERLDAIAETLSEQNLSYRRRLASVPKV